MYHSNFSYKKRSFKFCFKKKIFLTIKISKIMRDNILLFYKNSTFIPT